MTTAKGPAEFLKDFKGSLHVDGYEGYNQVVIRPDMKRAACMDHVRRKFEAALEYDRSRATYALEQMKAWYEVERFAREQNLTIENRLALRSEKTVPTMSAFGDWLKTNMLEVLLKSSIGTPMAYALNQWSYFDPVMTDGRIELSNILIENAIRPVAIGRKNYMFCGSHEAAKRAAMIYSLVSIAKLHDVDPFVYIKDLLEKLPLSKCTAVEQFLLPAWKSLQEDN